VAGFASFNASLPSQNDTSYVQSGEANMRSEGFYFGENHIIDFVVVKTCRLIRWCKRFEEIYCLPLQGVMKQNTTVWKNRQTVSYITSIYTLLLRIDGIAFGSFFILKNRSPYPTNVSEKLF